MSAPLIPEAVNLPPNVNPPAPVTPPIDPMREELDRLNGSALSTLHQRLAAAEAREQLLLERMKSNTPPPNSTDFLSDPVPIMRREMQETVAPLVQFVNGFQKNQQYIALKSNFKQQYPQISNKLSDVEFYVDKIMENLDPTEQNLQAAMTQVIGMQAMGTLPSNRPVAVNQPPTIPPSAPSPLAPTPLPVSNQPMSAPPNIPPSPPTLPSATPPSGDPAAQLASKVAALTEEERKVARIWGQTPEEYISLRDAGNEVSSWVREGKK